MGHILLIFAIPMETNWSRLLVRLRDSFQSLKRTVLQGRFSSKRSPDSVRFTLVAIRVARRQLRDGKLASG
jgi:hypothetical protein